MTAHLSSFFRHSGGSWFGKCLFLFCKKSQAFLLTHCLPMPSILLNITRICGSQFKCNYLKKENLFLNFLFNFSNLHQISNILKEKMMVLANVFPKLLTVKILVDHSLKIVVSENALTVNMWKCPKSSRNLYDSTFIMFLHHSERI